MAKDDYAGLILIAGAGALAYILYENGTLANMFPSLFVSKPVTVSAAPVSNTVPATIINTQSPAPSAAGAPAGGGTSSSGAPPPTPSLTVADAASLPYSSAITADQMQSVHDALVTELQGGQIPVIAGNSVLAFMLGWGGASAGQTATAVTGETYSFDGSNWNLVFTPPVSGVPPACGSNSIEFLNTLKNSPLTADQWNSLYNLPIACAKAMGVSGLGYRNGHVSARMLHRGPAFRIGR